jgi:hypothetical protein
LRIACGTEITSETTGHHFQAERTFRPASRAIVPVNVECVVKVHGELNGGDICRGCVIDTVMAADIRPSLEGAT